MDIKEFLVFDYNNILCKQISWLGINIVSLSSVLNFYTCSQCGNSDANSDCCQELLIRAY